MGSIALALALLTRGAEARSCGGVTYADSKVVAGKNLVLNGMGIREATVFKVDVYVAGLYLEKRGTDGPEIARSEQVKVMALTLVRDVESGEMNEAIEGGFKKNAGERFKSLVARIEKFKKAMPDLHEKDVLELTYAPQQGLSVKVNGKVRAQIEGADFASTLFLIWLGPNPPNPGLKRGLLGGRC